MRRPAEVHGQASAGDGPGGVGGEEEGELGDLLGLEQELDGHGLDQLQLRNDEALRRAFDLPRCQNSANRSLGPGLRGGSALARASSPFFKSAKNALARASTK